MKAESESSLLQEIAEAIADSTPVDWESSEELDQESKDSVRQLRIIESVAAVHRASDEVSTPAVDGVAESGPARAFSEASAPAPLPFPKWGSLELLEFIGKGGFGKVYRVWDPSLGRDVALKLLDTDRSHDEKKVKRFLDEARRLARVRHPNILVVHGADRHEGQVGLWTDLLQGTTLEERLSQQGPSSAHEASLVGIELCHALAAVHRAGLVHGDVKTTNVMRQQGGRIILLDFSAARECRPLDASGNEEPVVGTPRFMAPEVLLGESECTTAADIYSLGVLLYRLVSGRFPVEGKTFSELSEKIRNGHSTPILDVRSNLPDAFVQVLDRAMARDPSQRYATVGEMEHALATAVGVEPLPKDLPDVRAWWQQPVFALALAALLVIGVLVGPVLKNWLWPPELRVEASLFRTNEGLEQRLHPGQRIYVGDLVFLEIRGSSALHVYVMNEDETGNGIVLFPVAGLDVQNPLSADTAHRLPPNAAGTESGWEFTSEGGRESIFVIASRKPLASFEAEFAEIRKAGLQEPDLIASQIEEGTSRGMDVVVIAPPSVGPRGPASEYFSKISQLATEDPGIWVWRIQLENPGD